MQNTDKTICVQLATLLSEHGVKRVFISPGSRNAPIIVAVARNPRLETTVVIDERCAAFMAMGYAAISGEPVALVCTSGTALLNYAPAVAEAFYRKLPLIVISADRPAEWIDQDDSQTLRQHRALDNYVKLSCDIPEITAPNLLWYGNRLINDALIAARTGRQAPVHINLQLDAPLGRLVDRNDAPPRVVGVLSPADKVPAAELHRLRDAIDRVKKVMVIAGFGRPDHALNNALAEFAKRPNTIVLTETISNLHSDRFISCIDTVLSAMTDDEKAAMRPDIVITVGGALVSRFVKEYIRATAPAEHWHVGISHTTIDCFKSLTLRVEVDPATFFAQLTAGAVSADPSSSYSASWHAIAERARASALAYAEGARWSDLKAFQTIFTLVDRRWALQLSNGTPVRYAQLFGDIGMARNDCNRGVSGIDGCTSTAIGAAMAAPGAVTLLITGDMSAQYDVGALAYGAGIPGFKLVVMCNGGGGIFRFIASTSHLPELDRYLAAEPRLPLRQLADGYGYAMYEAASEAELRDVWPNFAAEADRPAILAVKTDPHTSAETLKNYFTRDKKQ